MTKQFRESSYGEIKVTIEQELQLPSVPNFIFLKQSEALKQDGFRESPKVHIKDLSYEALVQIGDAWKKELLSKAGYE